MVEYVGEYGAGASVDMEDGRIGNALLIICRLHHPAVDLIAVAGCEGKGLGGHNGIFLSNKVVEVGDLLTVQVKLRKLCSLELTAYQVIAVDVEAVAGASLCEAVGDIAVLVQLS